MRTDLWPRARGDEIVVRPVQHFDFATRHTAHRQIGLVERAFIRLT